MLRTLLTARALTVGLSTLMSAAPAAGQTWTGNASNIWVLPSNWSSNPSLPASSPDTRLIFGATSNALIVNPPLVPFQLNRMTFTTAAPAYSFAGSALDFHTNGQGVDPQIVQNSDRAVTINTDVVLTSSLTAVGTGTGTVSLNGTLSGAGGLIMSGAGRLVLGGASNSFTGNVEVTSGTLSIVSPTAIPTGRNVTVRQGAGFRIDFTNSGNFQDAIGRLTLDGGTLRGPTGSGDYFIDRMVVNSSGGVPGAIDFSGGTTFALRLTETGASPGITVQTNTTWTGGGSTRIQNDSAATLDIATNGHTITSNIRLTSGTPGQGFRVTGGGTLALSNSASSAHLTADGSILEVANLAHLGSGIITLQQTAGGDSGTLKYTGPSGGSSKSLVLGTGGGEVWLPTSGTNLTLLGPISETAPGQRLLVSGFGKLTLVGLNTYTGPTHVGGRAGELSVPTLPNGGVAGPLGASTNAPANLVLGADGNSGHLRYTGPTATTDRGMTFWDGGHGSISVLDPAANLTVTGQVTGGHAAVAGPGTLTLANGTNNFTGGASVGGGGTLAISHARAIPAGSDVTVYSGNKFQIAYGTGDNSAGPIGTLYLNGGTFTAPTSGLTRYYINRLEQMSGGGIDFTGSNGFALGLTGPGAGITVTGDAAWTGAGTSVIRNDTANLIDLSIAPDVTLTSSVRLTNGASGEGLRLTGGGTLVVTNTDSNVRWTVGPATLQSGSVDGFGSLFLTLDGGTLAYSGPTDSIFMALTLADANGTLAVTNPATTLNWPSQINGGYTLTKAGAGTLLLSDSDNAMSRLVVNAGRVDVASDAPLGTGAVAVNAAGTLRYTSTATTARTFTLNGGTLEVSTGVTLTLDGAAVNGGFLASSGAGRFIATGSTSVNGATLFGGTTVEVTGLTAFTNTTTGANITVATGQTLSLTRGRQTAAGTLTVHGTVSAPQGWESLGVLRVTGGANPGLMTVGGAPLVLGGGSRTFVGANAAGQRGGTINLGGQTLELNGGLLVNNGDFVSNGVGGIQGGAVNVNYGSLAKGTGYYDEVNVTEGGKFAPGNSITDSGIGTLTLNSGSVYEFEINLANGVAGGGGTTPPQGWDRLSMNRMNVNSTLESPAIIQLVSRNASDTGPGILPDFDPAQSYRWQAFQAEVFTGFAPDKFTFDTTGFANLINPSGVGTFALERSGSSVFVTYAPVPEPGLMLAIAAAGLATGRLARRRLTRVASRGTGD